MRTPRPAATDIPPGATLAHQAFDRRPDFADAWQLPLHPGMDRAPEAWRNVLPFPVMARSPTELLLGEDAGHLDFRASILIENDTVTLSTVVRIHNRRGRLYFAVIRRVHPPMARLMLRRTHRRMALGTLRN